MTTDWKLAGRRVAIIGGGGFIGHNLALALKARGAEVELVDSLAVNNLGSFAGQRQDLHNRRMYLDIIHQRLDLLHAADIPLHVQDARDYHALTRIICHGIKPDVVVHLAAVAHAGRSNKDPYSTFDHSLRTLENALDAARSGVEHFVFFSSSMVYGHFIDGVADEQHPIQPLGIYGALKAAGEQLVVAYHQVFGLNYTIVRPSALYGPRCVSRRVGQVFIENALAGATLRMSGDGQERVDFTYIDDLVDGVCLVLQSPAARNEVFNLTYGESRSIGELAEVIKAHFPEANVESEPRDELMPLRGTLKVDKARRLLGYEPSFPLERGIPRYIEWYRALQQR